MIGSWLRFGGRIGCAISCLWLAQALTRADAFDEAARLYEKGQGTEAVSAYEAILKAKGPSFELLYNLGNAEFRAGSPGRALFAWREAAKLNPRDSDLLANISMVLKKTGQTEPVGLAKIASRIRAAEAAWALLAVNAVWGALLLIGARRPDFQHRTTAGRWLAAILSVALWMVYGGVQWFRYQAPDTIVIKTDVSARYGPIEESPKAFDTPEAAELHTLAARNGWYEVVDSAGRRGWIAGDQIKIRRR